MDRTGIFKILKKIISHILGCGTALLLLLLIAIVARLSAGDDYMPSQYLILLAVAGVAMMVFFALWKIVTCFSYKRP